MGAVVKIHFIPGCVWEFDVDFQAVPNLKDVENLLTPPHVLSKVVVAVATSVCNIKLDGGGALEGQGGVVVIIVGAVKVSLESRSLGNLNQDLVHDVVGNIGTEHVEDEAVSSGQGQIVQPPGLHASHQD